MLDRWRRRDEDKYNRYVRDKIRSAREEKGWSQAQLARELDRTQAYVSSIESGRTAVSIVDLMGFAQALEKPIASFFPIPEPREGNLSTREWEIVHHFRKIQNDGMELLAIKQVKQIADASIEADDKANREEVRELKRQKEEDKKAKRKR